MVRFFLKQAETKCLLKIFQRLSHSSYVRLRLSCRFCNDFAETNKALIKYTIDYLTIHFSTHVKYLDPNVDYIQLPTQWLNILRSFKLNEFNIDEFFPSFQFRKLVITISFIHDQELFSSFLNSLRLKSIHLTINFCVPIDTSTLIANCEPQKLTLYYCKLDADHVRLPVIREEMEECEVFTELCLSNDVIGNLNNVKRIILYPRQFHTFAKILRLFNGILTDEFGFQHLALEIKSNIALALKKPHNFVSLVRECIVDKDHDPDDLSYEEIIIDEKFNRKVDVLLTDGGVFGILQGPDIDGEMRTFLHYLPQGTDRLTWDCQPYRSNSDDIFVLK